MGGYWYKALYSSFQGWPCGFFIVDIDCLWSIWIVLVIFSAVYHEVHYERHASKFRNGADGSNINWYCYQGCNIEGVGVDSSPFLRKRVGVSKKHAGSDIFCETFWNENIFNFISIKRIIFFMYYIGLQKLKIHSKFTWAYTIGESHF